MAYHAVTKTEEGGARFLNYVTMREDEFLLRQIEERDGRVFMRVKKRVLA